MVVRKIIIVVSLILAFLLLGCSSIKPPRDCWMNEEIDMYIDLTISGGPKKNGIMNTPDGILEIDCLFWYDGGFSIWHYNEERGRTEDNLIYYGKYQTQKDRLILEVDKDLSIYQDKEKFELFLVNEEDFNIPWELVEGS